VSSALFAFRSGDTCGPQSGNGTEWRGNGTASERGTGREWSGNAGGNGRERYKRQL